MTLRQCAAATDAERASRAESATVYVALGSNVGRRRAQMAAALTSLHSHSRIAVSAVSALYETAPVGGPSGQPDYLNAAAALHTDLTPSQLLAFTQALERELGRRRDTLDGPRTIDIDLLHWTNASTGRPLCSDAPPILPHPRLHARLFVLRPLTDIAADALHPALNRTFAALLDQCAKDCRVDRVAEAPWWTTA